MSEQHDGVASDMAGTAAHADTLPSSPDHQLDPERLDHFRIIEPIGRGGMGAVYRAHDESLDREVALKVLPPDFGGDAWIERFRREAQSQARLSHPNVVPIYFVGEAHGRHYFAMELVEGESLADRLERGEPTGWVEAIDIFLDVVRGLRQAHERGLVHRDIKPGNILVTTDGLGRVADFGLAKLVDVADGERPAAAMDSGPELTQPGAFLGTPLYVAPEQALGKPLDHRADIYALGASMFHVVVGEPLFDGANTVALVNAHANEAPDLTRLPEAVSPGFVETLDRMLAKKPDERFADYAELAGALEAAKPRELIPVPWVARLGTVVGDAVFVFMMTALLSFSVGTGVFLPYSAGATFLIATSFLWRATPAQALVGHEVVSATDAHLTPRSKLSRSLALPLPVVAIDAAFMLRWEFPDHMAVLFAIPIILAMFGPCSAALREDHRGLHDVLSGVTVVENRSRSILELWRRRST